MNTALTDISVELLVPDFDIAKDFYGKLGFKIAWEEPADKMNGYLVMYRDKSIICFFCGNDYVYEEEYLKMFPRDTKRGLAIQISIPVEDIDEVYKDISSRIDKKFIFQPLKQHPWGKKDFRLTDPFGFFLRFNEPWNVLETLPLEGDYE